MNKETRTKQIYTNIYAFSKDKYTKEELVKEYEILERQIVETTFNEEHADYSKFKLWHVEKHLEQMNEEKGGKYENQLLEFKGLNSKVIEMIKKYHSGSYGEYLASKSIKTMSCLKIQINNLELSKDEFTTEIDSLIITEKGVYLIEVKNTKRDILIDEKGNYIRISDYESFDCQLGEKMNHKEYLVREVLKSNGFENVKLTSIVVFTNSHIKVTNNYNYIKHCFLSDLPHIISNDECDNIYTKKDMNKIANILEQAETKKEYFPDIDIEKYKQVFSQLMSSLEFEEDYVQKVESVKETKQDQHNKTTSKKDIKWGYILGLVTTFIGGFATHALIKNNK